LGETGTSFRTLPSFPRISGAGSEQRYAPPALGEHTSELLRAIGYSETEIEQFKAESVI
jgi:crotonobetainyl-CoA:carnitine CoA-transferase CaiB-like acyl-CoA transferase